MARAPRHPRIGPFPTPPLPVLHVYLHSLRRLLPSPSPSTNLINELKGKAGEINPVKVYQNIDLQLHKFSSGSK